MRVTSVAVFPVNSEKAKTLKANGVVTLEDSIELKCLVIEGSKGPFVTWKGSEKYNKNDGSTGYSHAIFVKDKELNQSIQKAVLDKLSAVSGGGGAQAQTASSTPAVDSSFTADDIPF